MKPILLAAAFLAISTATTHAIAIALSGFNQDLIAENNATGPQSGSSTDFSSWTFSERGAPGNPATRGFSTGGLLTTANAGGTPGSTFQLAPFSGGANVLSNNALIVGLNDDPLTRQLNFSNPAQQTRYSDLQFFTFNQGASTSWNAILVFSDTSTSTYTVATNRPDWTVAPALPGIFRYDNNGLVMRNGDNDWTTGNYTAGLYGYEDRILLTAADQLKTLTGVRFDATATGVGVVVFATNTTPEPAITTFLSLGILTLATRRRRAGGRALRS